MNVFRASWHQLAFLLSIFMLVSCENCEEEQDDFSKKRLPIQNRIMPLGASRVEGNSPHYESFRYPLWKKLIENKWRFNFIGTQTDSTDYPDFNNRQFDFDHEGRGGWTSGEILQGLPFWLRITAIPDIVLFSSPGGNDALRGLPYEETLANINKIIEVLREKNPQVIILIELMAPVHEDAMTPEIAQFIDQVHRDVLDISLSQSTELSPIFAIDMYSNFQQSYLADELHYNVAGSEFVANRYYNTLQHLLSRAVLDSLQ